MGQSLPLPSFVGHFWGKADPNYPDEPKWHPLAYHCLDVAAVACVWWDTCTSLQGHFMAAFPGESGQARLRAWIMFFVALHDLGKFDIRFQLKALDAMAAAWRRLDKSDHGISDKAIREFDHGHAGLAWARREQSAWIGASEQNPERWDAWHPWLAAVTGHHGDYPKSLMSGLRLDTDKALIAHDHQARQAFVRALEALFLAPAGLSLKDCPPPCSLPARALIAGFCSVCDWIGSNTEVFKYRTPEVSLEAYLAERLARIHTDDTLAHFGLLATPHVYTGLSALLKAGEQPRGVQTEIDALPAAAGLTLVEAPTGSGKTEAALAYAWRLLDTGVADSIVFALPTQATANAMLLRAQAFAACVYGNANVVLAHGKREFNEAFLRLAESGRRVTRQGKVEAAVQCAAWLASSRKRVFLGQIGVCTVDQVLLSVLPVRHKFVRGFGLAKSVLIVDEVHAYDAYMHGLLGEVLRAQKGAGGSAILLSATLPARLRDQLLQSWDASGQAEAPYPALWHTSGGAVEPRTVDASQRPAKRVVETECLKLDGAFPDESLIVRIVEAARAGAQVATVMNLVDDAQRLARLLRARPEVEQAGIEIDLFHARFRFADRQEKERACVERYGRDGTRERGRILVATQVVEQSLDLDFDWMLTQICPVDLLFQRLGRLHRHQRESRPAGFESPRCTVLSVTGDDYGLHKLIYGNTRVLCRTERLLRGAPRGEIIFPEAYRTWIEQVYDSEIWDDEPDAIYADYLSWKDIQAMREADAKKLTTMTVSSFRDEDAQITGLTRDGEMSLNVLPVLPDGRLLDSRRLADLPEREQAEVLNLYAIPVPAGWGRILHDCPFDKEGPLAGYWQLSMQAAAPGSWSAANAKFHYSQDFGLEKARNESA